MKQLVQSARAGEAQVVDVPAPRVQPGTVLVRTAASLVSAGTERMVVEFSRRGLVGKARSRPDLVRQMVEKAKREGVLTAWEAARARLARPLTPGYSCAGTVVEVGPGVIDLAVGDRVACAGAGSAVHAELVCVPRNLVARVPTGVELDAAAFTTVGAIALHGFRLAELQLGESVAVIGLGLIGVIATQLARAAGCRVLGIDVNRARVELARTLGADAAVVHGGERVAGGDARTSADALTGGRGVDAAVVTAATASSGPIRLAAELCRDRGRVVVVGVVGMEVPRSLYYQKELDLRVARSYGAGRYDPAYEEGGHDYPIAYVRWTENRNMEAFLELLARGEVRVSPLITHRFAIEAAPRAYALIAGERAEPYLGIVLTYPPGEDDGTHGRPAISRRVDMRPPAAGASAGEVVRVGLLGAGNFATGTLLPAMARVGGAELVGVCAASGASARHAAARFGFRYCTADEDEIFADPSITAVVIATRHHLHAGQLEAALRAGKHVFCEKPPALDDEELGRVVRAYAELSGSAGQRVSGSADSASASQVGGERRGEGAPAPVLAVGYNRRFAPLAAKLKAFLADVAEPLAIHYRVNAGFIPAQHWVQDPGQGGGRIVGEVCHFVDFLTYLADELPVAVYARALPDGGRYRNDNVVLTVEYPSGTVGSITYVANGDGSLGKERAEVFGGGAAAVLDDFRSLVRVQGGHRLTDRSRLRQDKGHRGEWEAFVRAVREGGPPPIPFEELLSTSLVTFRALDSLRSGERVVVDAASFIRRSLARQPDQDAPGHAE